MKALELLKAGAEKLNSYQMAKLLLTSYLEVSEKDILMNIEVNEAQIAKYKQGVFHLAAGKPIQYLIGKVNFSGYEFKITKDVLIPRFETELLVDETMNYIRIYFKAPKIIDLGCGSGVIGITIKKTFPDAIVTCLDISEKALMVTKMNSKNLKAEINIVKGDMLKGITEKYDIIISNPPYIDPSEKIDPIVLNNEPHQALFAPSGGLYFYEEILKTATKNLNPKSILAFEIGSTQADAVHNIAKKYFPRADVIIKKDLAGKDRYVFILNNA